MKQDKLIETIIKHKLKLILVLGACVGVGWSRVSFVDAFFDLYPNADSFILIPTAIFCLWLLSALKKHKKSKEKT